MADEKRFLDRAGLKQALVLIKNLIADTKTELKAEIAASNTDGGTALANAKAELNEKIATNATNLANTNTALTNAINTASTTAATNLASVKSELEGVISANKTNIETALANAKTQIAQDLQDAKLKFKIVEALPLLADADPRVVYMVLDNEPNKTADEKNIYIEYMVVVDDQGEKVRWEEIGDTQLSLVEYEKTATVDQKISDAVQDTLSFVEETNYVKNENFLTTYEVIALFEDSCIVVKSDGTYVKYDDALEAIADAEAGQTVVVKEDLEIPAGFVVSEDITIDLNGYEMKEA